jgi:hypothetical protein
MCTKASAQMLVDICIFICDNYICRVWKCLLGIISLITFVLPKPYTYYIFSSCYVLEREDEKSFINNRFSGWRKFTRGLPILKYFPHFFIKEYLMVSVFGWPDPIIHAGILRELRKAEISRAADEWSHGFYSFRVTYQVFGLGHPNTETTRVLTNQCLGSMHIIL